MSFWKFWNSLPGAAKVILIVVILVVIYLLYLGIRKMVTGKEPGSKYAPMDYPNSGSGIPEGWDARPVAVKLYNAMDGWGTDEDLIWGALDGLTDDQLVAVYNEFGNRYEADLLTWFEDDLSGEDLSRALGYFEGLKID